MKFRGNSVKQIDKYTVKEICNVIGAELPSEYSRIADDKLTNITSQINELESGGGFFLFGNNLKDREKQLTRVLDLNPKIIFAGRASRKLIRLQEIPHVFVDDAYEAMVSVSAVMRANADVTVIGVTGSLGKTTTKELVYSVLNTTFSVEKSYNNRNSSAGILLGVQNLSAETEFYVQEFGVAIGKRSMESKISTCLPDAAIVTNISDSHIEILESRENILKEKIKLVTEMPEGCPAFLNYDDEILRSVKLDKHPVISYAIYNREADYYVENLKIYGDYMIFDIIHNQVRTPVKINALGVHNVSNAVAAMAIGEWAGVPRRRIQEGISAFKSEGIRQTLTNIGGYKLYLDCYNAAPVSLIGAIHSLENIPIETGGRRIAVVADMRSLGQQSEKLHMEVGDQIGKSKVDLVICFGNLHTKKMADAIKQYKKAVIYTDNRDTLNMIIRQNMRKQDILLFKGSNATMLHKSVDQVFGSCYHLDEDPYYITESMGDYRVKIVSEEDETKKTAAIIEYTGCEKDIFLPARYNGIEIFSIARHSFENNPKIRKVHIPESVANISEKAFKNCIKLKKVSFSKGLKKIEKESFFGCKSLKELVIPEGVIDIGEKAFAECKALRKVVLPKSLGRIDADAFEGCNRVKFINTIR